QRPRLGPVIPASRASRPLASASDRVSQSLQTANPQYQLYATGEQAVNNLVEALTRLRALIQPPAGAEGGVSSWVRRCCRCPPVLVLVGGGGMLRSWLSSKERRWTDVPTDFFCPALPAGHADLRRRLVGPLDRQEDPHRHLLPHRCQRL